MLLDEKLYMQIDIENGIKWNCHLVCIVQCQWLLCFII